MYCLYWESGVALWLNSYSLLNLKTYSLSVHDHLKKTQAKEGIIINTYKENIIQNNNISLNWWDL